MDRAVLLMIGLSLPLAGWGPKGHRIAAEGALRTLPPELRSWYAGHETRFQEAALAPDQWKEEDPKEAARHHIRVEAYGGPDRIPFEAEEAIRRAGDSVFVMAGQLPWVIGDRYHRLVEAFRSRDSLRVVDESAWLCHYVADAQVPLHTTRNHDGKKTGQKGVHGRWEKGLVEWKMKTLTELRPARPPQDPSRVAWTWVSESYAQVPGLLEGDREALRRADPVDPGSPKNDSYWLFFWEHEQASVVRQLRRSAERTGDLVLAAWMKAGEPSCLAGRAFARDSAREVR